MHSAKGGNSAAMAAACVLVVGLQHTATPEKWLGVFQGFPGARQLCSSHVLGFEGAQQVEISFTVYASSREASEVVRFYARAHGLPSKPWQKAIDVRPNEGPDVLSVSPVSSQYPECGVKPSGADRTLIVVSHKSLFRP